MENNIDKEIINELESLKERDYPNIVRFFNNNPDSLVRSIKNMKEREPNIPISTFIINLEIDMAHM